MKQRQRNTRGLEKRSYFGIFKELSLLNWFKKKIDKERICNHLNEISDLKGHFVFMEKSITRTMDER